MAVGLVLDNRLRSRVSDNLRQLEIKPVDLERANNSRHAAVAITLINCQAGVNLGDIVISAEDVDQAAFILTTRASNLNNHAGQRAFPGGRIDAGETPEKAALRELAEEVGLRLKPENILGRLDDYATRSGFVITPIVVWGGHNVELSANPDEVESIHRIPVSELMRSDAPILESIPESEHPVLKMPLGNEWFAAPTAAIAYQFREVCILGNHTRVAHFEQPYFAWK